MATVYVVVPVYKVEKYISVCVDSILQQTFRDYSLILVDDGSPDNCPAICDKYALNDKRIKVIHQTNKKQGAARNAGIELALQDLSCQYITFIDSDDWVDADYLESLVNALECKNADVSMMYYQTEREQDATRTWCGENTHISRCVSLMNNLQACSQIDSGLDGFAFAVVWGKLFKKDLWRTVRFPENIIYEDTYTIHQPLYYARRISLIDASGYHYRIRMTGVCGSSFSLNQVTRLWGYLDRADFFMQHNEAELSLIAQRLFLYGVAEFVKNCRQHKETGKEYLNVKREFVRVFDAERKSLSFWQDIDLWRRRYPMLSIFLYGIKQTRKVLINIMRKT